MENVPDLSDLLGEVIKTEDIPWGHAAPSRAPGTSWSAPFSSNNNDAPENVFPQASGVWKSGQPDALWSMLSPRSGANWVPMSSSTGGWQTEVSVNGGGPSIPIISNTAEVPPELPEDNVFQHIWPMPTSKQSDAIQERDPWRVSLSVFDHRPNEVSDSTETLNKEHTLKPQSSTSPQNPPEQAENSQEIRAQHQLNACAGGRNSQNDVDDPVDKLVNDNVGWGSTVVDQVTTWDLTAMEEEENNAIAQAKLASASVISYAGCYAPRVPILPPQGESNEWNSEPSTGTAIWEMHYEQIGRQTGSRWRRSSSQQQQQPQQIQSRQSSVNSPTGAAASAAIVNSSRHYRSGNINTSPSTPVVEPSAFWDGDGGQSFVPVRVSSLAHQQQCSASNLLPTPSASAGAFGGAATNQRRPLLGSGGGHGGRTNNDLGNSILPPSLWPITTTTPSGSISSSNRWPISGSSASFFGDDSGDNNWTNRNQQQLKNGFLASGVGVGLIDYDVSQSIDQSPTDNMSSTNMDNGLVGGAFNSQSHTYRADLVRHLLSLGYAREEINPVLIECNMDLDKALVLLRQRHGAGGSFMMQRGGAAGVGPGAFLPPRMLAQNSNFASAPANLSNQSFARAVGSGVRPLNGKTRIPSPPGSAYTATNLHQQQTNGATNNGVGSGTGFCSLLGFPPPHENGSLMLSAAQQPPPGASMFGPIGSNHRRSNGASGGSGLWPPPPQSSSMFGVADLQRKKQDIIRQMQHYRSNPGMCSQPQFSSVLHELNSQLQHVDAQLQTYYASSTAAAPISQNPSNSSFMSSWGGAIGVDTIDSLNQRMQEMRFQGNSNRGITPSQMNNPPSPHSYYGRLNGSAAAASSSAASAFRRFEEPPTWLLIRSSAAALETFLPQQAIGLISMLPVPGAPGCWLARFISPAAAMDTARYLANIVGHVEPISERDAQRLVGLDAGNIINKM